MDMEEEDTDTVWATDMAMAMAWEMVWGWVWAMAWGITTTGIDSQTLASFVVHCVVGQMDKDKFMETVNKE